VVLAVSFAFAAYAFLTETALWQRGVASLLVAVAIGGIVETARKLVRLDDDGLYFVGNFRGASIKRSDIESVAWGGGSDVSLTLVDGRHVPLPEVGAGSQALANSIRAWLKRTR
jgi:hypothetical protein